MNLVKRTAALTVLVSAALLLSGCSSAAPAATTASTDSGSTNQSAPTVEEKAVHLGPKVTEDGRAPSEGSVPVPVGPSSVEGVFCEISVDGQLTQYRALQISGFASAATDTGADTANFTSGMGYKDAEQAAAVGKKFAKVGAALEKLTAKRNVGVPSEWEDRIDGYCANVLAGE